MQHIAFVGASGLMGHGMAKNIRAKDLRHYSHLTESVKMPSIIDTSVRQALNTAVALGYGSEMVPSLVKAQAQLNQVNISPA